jgi:hypothetical protein
MLVCKCCREKTGDDERRTARNDWMPRRASRSSNGGAELIRDSLSEIDIGIFSRVHGCLPSASCDVVSANNLPGSYMYAVYPRVGVVVPCLRAGPGEHGPQKSRD